MPTGKRRELRDVLLEAIEQVKDGTLNPAQASAVADLSQAVLRVDQFELDAMAFVAEHGKPERLTTRKPLAITHEEEPEEEADEELEDDEDDEEPEPPRPPIKSKQVASPTVEELKKAIKMGGPSTLKDIARYVERPESKCFEVLKGKEFERDTDGVYWLSR